MHVTWRCRYGILYVFMQAVGAIISHVALTSSEIGIMSSAWIRLVSSGIYVFLCLFVQGDYHIPFFSLAKRDQYNLTMAIQIECAVGHSLQ